MSNNKVWLILPLFCLEKTNGKFGITIGWLTKTFTITFGINNERMV